MRSSDLYRELLEQLRNDLCPQPDKPDENPQSTLDTLWLAAQGDALSARLATAQNLTPLDLQQTTQLRALLRRRLSGIPLAHLTGRQHFMGLELLASPDALVPRVETEILAHAAVDIALRRPLVSAPRILDVCTGSGNIALVLAKQVPTAVIGGCDLSEAAAALAKKNAERLQLSERVEFRVGDLLTPFRDAEWSGKIDLITCNPPYISSSKVAGMVREIAAHEPSIAFDGGPFGVSILMRLLQEAPEMLKPNGWLVFEVGLGQGPAMDKRLKTGGRFRNIEPRRDSNGQIRAIAAQCG